MALIKVTYASDVMKRQISLSAYIPIDNGQPRPEYGYRTLVMLHGLTADGSSWIRESDIEAMARERNLAVLFPSGENSFYVQGLAPNSDYGELVGREIVEFARGLFPLSARREDTFIGGLSMGGFGALRNGLKYADTFARVISFSAAIHMFEFEPGDPRRHMVCHEDMVMGDYAAARQTDRNPAVCLEALKARGYVVLASDLNGADFYHRPDPGACFTLVIGNEARGISVATREAATALVKLPMRGGAESLNSAVAAGIMMYEMMRES